LGEGIWSDVTVGTIDGAGGSFFGVRTVNFLGAESLESVVSALTCRLWTTLCPVLWDVRSMADANDT
jgi:hypothetical protein